MVTAWGSPEPRRARPNSRSSPDVPWLKTGLSTARNDSRGRPRLPPGNNIRTRSRISGIHILPATKGFHPGPSYLGSGGPNTPETCPDAREKADSHQDTIFPFTACLQLKSSDNAPFSYRVRPVRKPKATHTFRTRKSRRRWDGQLQRQHGSIESKAYPGTTPRTGGLRRRVVLADMADVILPKAVVEDGDRLSLCVCAG